MKGVLTLLVSVCFLSACSVHEMEYGVASRTGVIFYPLCERSQQRIMDLKRASFDMPAMIKNSPCRNWPDYTHSLNDDRVGVSIPTRVVSGNTVVVGGALGLGINGRNYKKKWHYGNPPEK